MLTRLYKKLLSAGIIVSTGTLILVVCLQILGRFVLPVIPDWTEEVSRFSLLYIVAFAIPLTFCEKGFVYVDIVVSALKGRIRTALLLLIEILVFTSSCLVVYQGFRFAFKMGSIQTSPSLGIPMIVPYISIPLGILFMLPFACARLIRLIKEFK